MNRLSRFTQLPNAITAAAGIALTLAISTLTGCASSTPRPQQVQSIIPSPPVLIAESATRQWTGVAVTPQGRVFVNFPRWGEPYTYAVEEVLPDGSRRAYPDPTTNSWQPGIETRSRFVCVQALYADDEGFLWVLDAGNPEFGGVVDSAAKLVKIELETNNIVATYIFGKNTVEPDSYLNDVRIDTKRDFAYITDSGNGAIIAFNLRTIKARRLLDDHPSTQAEQNFTPTIEGRPWQFRDGSAPQIHADGIALSRNGEYLYWQSLTGRDLYRVPTALLRDSDMPMRRIGEAVELVERTVVTDGMLIDDAGYLYFTALENDAIYVRDDAGKLWVLTQGPEISWPDSMAVGPDGHLYFTTSQIHRSPLFSPDGSVPEEPYKLFKVPTPWAPGAPRR